VIEVSGRTFPVDVHYRPMADSEDDLYGAITSAVSEILETEKGSTRRGGDILIFMSGEREIREAALALRHAKFPHLDILPLYARLSLEDQNKVFNSHKGRRVVLATKLADIILHKRFFGEVIDMTGKKLVKRRKKK